MRKFLPSFKVRDLTLCCIPAALYIISLILYFSGNIRIGADFILSSTVLLDVAIFHFTLRKPKRHIVMLIFTICFNVLLLSRVFTKWIIDYDNLYLDIEASDVSNMYSALSMVFLGLAFVFLAYRLCGFLLKNREAAIDNNFHYQHRTDKLIPVIRILSLVGFFVFFVFSLYSAIVTAEFVSEVGYLESFKQSPDIGYFVRQLATLLLPAYALFLATKPTKKQLIVPTVFYFVIMLLSLLGGRRNIFTRDALLLIIYFLARDDFRSSAKKFFTKLKVAITAGTGLFAMYFLQGMRTNFSSSFFRTIFNFIYDQGSSIRVVVKTVLYRDIFSDNPLRYFLYPLEMQLRNGYLGNILFKLTPIVEQQTAAFAASTYNYAHKLTYFVDPARYLNGGGFGATYIADGYIIAGVAGVIILSIVLGCMIRFFPSLLTRSVFTTAFGLIVVRYIVYMPRNFFLGFVSEAFNPACLMFYAAVFVISLVIVKLGNISAGKAEQSSRPDVGGR